VRRSQLGGHRRGPRRNQRRHLLETMAEGLRAPGLEELLWARLDRAGREQRRDRSGGHSPSSRLAEMGASSGTLQQSFDSSASGHGVAAWRHAAQALRG
jgi:hypothetical protein